MKMKKNKIKVNQPTKFILNIKNCGTDTLSMHYKKIEHDNPIILGLNGINIMADGFSPKDAHAFFKYLIACALLKGLKFDRKKLFDDVDQIAERIKGLSLKNLK